MSMGTLRSKVLASPTESFRLMTAHRQVSANCQRRQWRPPLVRVFVFKGVRAIHCTYELKITNVICTSAVDTFLNR